jgi:hypothetical protein
LFYAFIHLFDQVASIEVCGRASVIFFFMFLVLLESLI